MFYKLNDTLIVNSDAIASLQYTPEYRGVDDEVDPPRPFTRESKLVITMRSVEYDIESTPYSGTFLGIGVQSQTHVLQGKQADSIWEGFCSRANTPTLLEG